jgi:hypothetical protein
MGAFRVARSASDQDDQAGMVSDLTNKRQKVLALTADEDQCALGDLRTHAHALMFALVADVVLDRRRHAGRLQPAHIGHGQFGRQPRIFGVALEIAAVVDRAVQVDVGREQHPCAFELGLGAGESLATVRRKYARHSGAIPRVAQRALIAPKSCSQK